jgi:hypothetical protein
MIDIKDEIRSLERLLRRQQNECKILRKERDLVRDEVKHHVETRDQLWQDVLADDIDEMLAANAHEAFQAVCDHADRVNTYADHVVSADDAAHWLADIQADLDRAELAWFRTRARIEECRAALAATKPLEQKPRKPGGVPLPYRSQPKCADEPIVILATPENDETITHPCVAGV